MASEGIGTAFLLTAVVGSGIMGDRLAGGNAAVALLANSLATGCALAVLIHVFSPLSQAHFNPMVSLAMAFEGRLPWRDLVPYAAVQIPAAFAGVMAAHLMFGEPVLSLSTKMRSGAGQWWSECIATFGLLLVIWGCLRRRSAATPLAVGAYIAAAYWFTASTSFANPAVTLARAASNTFVGIRPADVPGFIAAQLVGTAAALALTRWLSRGSPE